MNVKILIVDDEESICEILKYNLQLDGYMVDTALSPEEALSYDLPSYSLFILDIMMGDVSGFELANQIRSMSETEHTPIIFCSALNGEDDTVMGLNLGADDYITKPFTVNEVKARVRAVLRRANVNIMMPGVTQMRQSDINFRTMRVDRNECQVYIGGRPVKLTKREYDLLVFFLTHRNRTYSREEILQGTWPEDVVVSTRTIDTNITRLRQKIEPYGANIVTRLGYGYGFKEVN